MAGIGRNWESCTKHFKLGLKSCDKNILRLSSGDSIIRAGCFWWLRSPGNNSNNAAMVWPDGSVNDNGNNVDNTNVAVRPALHQYLKSSVLYGGPCLMQRSRIPSRGRA